MTKAEFVNELERMLELKVGALAAETELARVAEWDSLQALNFVMLVHGRLGVLLDGADVAMARTVGDLVGLVATRLSD